MKAIQPLELPSKMEECLEKKKRFKKSRFISLVWHQTLVVNMWKNKVNHST